MYGLIATVAMSVSAPVPPPPENAAAPTGPAPTLAFLKADNTGKVRVQVLRDAQVQAAPPIAPAQPGAAFVIARQIRRQETVELGEVKDLTITTVDGRKVDLEEALKRLQKGETVLIAPSGQPISPAYLKVFKDDTLILSSPELIAPANVAVPGRPLPVRPIQIQPAVPPAAVPVPPAAQIQGAIKIQQGNQIIEIDLVPPPLPAAPAVPAEKAAPVQKAVPPAQPALPQKLPAEQKDK